ncbi:MAG TPA: DUF1707 domain-containing protein [Mycobacteriales bacterium]|nr:DUF1707 domain-containing protein [Mycobacteriales bacterium]
MEISAQPTEPSRPATDADRQAGADLLQRACGDGRLTLEEFSDRVGAVWAAEATDQIAAATGGLEVPGPIVGSSRTVHRVVNVIGEQRLRGRWRLPGRLQVINLIGELDLDLCDVVVGETLPDNVVDIRVFSMIGEVSVVVPEGIEVQVSGLVLIGARDIHLAPVPRRVGTPLVRLHVFGLIGELRVESRPSGGTPNWRRAVER